MPIPKQATDEFFEAEQSIHPKVDPVSTNSSTEPILDVENPNSIKDNPAKTSSKPVPEPVKPKQPDPAQGKTTGTDGNEQQQNEESASGLSDEEIARIQSEVSERNARISELLTNGSFSGGLGELVSRGRISQTEVDTLNYLFGNNEEIDENRQQAVNEYIASHAGENGENLQNIAGDILGNIRGVLNNPEFQTENPDFNLAHKGFVDSMNEIENNLKRINELSMEAGRRSRLEVDLNNIDAVADAAESKINGVFGVRKGIPPQVALAFITPALALAVANPVVVSVAVGIALIKILPKFTKKKLTAGASVNEQIVPHKENNPVIQGNNPGGRQQQPVVSGQNNQGQQQPTTLGTNTGGQQQTVTLGTNNGGQTQQQPITLGTNNQGRQQQSNQPIQIGAKPVQTQNQGKSVGIGTKSVSVPATSTVDPKLTSTVNKNLPGLDKTQAKDKGTASKGTGTGPEKTPTTPETAIPAKTGGPTAKADIPAKPGGAAPGIPM